MKSKWNQKGRRYMAVFLAILMVWSLIPGNSFSIIASAANKVSGNEATPSNAEDVTEDTEKDESDKFADGDLVDDLASPSDAEKPDGVLDATPSNAAKGEAFEQSQTTGGITVRVTADPGVFPADATLHVELVEDTQLQEQIQTAVDETTGAKDESKKTVEKTMAFDITILDGEGNEVQPDKEKGQVKVSFEKVDTSNVEAGKSTLEVFHFNEDNTQAEKLDAEVDVNAKTVKVQAEHFSLYVLQLYAARLTEPAQVDGVYQIGTADDLWAFAAIVDGTDGFTRNTRANAVLTQDIDANGRSWKPIGSVFAYYGTFDGRGYTIRGLEANLSDTEYVGLFGRNSGIIKNVNVVDFKFNGNKYVGGVCANNGNIIENCTAIGSVSGSVSGIDYIGGVTGQNSGRITNCINIGRVSGNKYVGGVCGYLGRYSTTTNCYYDNVECTVGGIGGNYVAGIVGNDVAGSAEGKTTEAFASGEVTWLLNGTYKGGTFTPGATDGSQTWYQNLDNGETVDAYPVLDSTHGTVYYKNSEYTNADPSIYEKPAAGDGTSGSPYQLESVGNLMWFAKYGNSTNNTGNQNANAVLTADIDMAGITWPGMASYSGTFDGAGFTIKNLNANNTGENTKGFVDVLQGNGVIENLHFDTVNVFIQNNNRSAVIAGENNGMISGCTVENATVQCGNYNGLAGIVASNNSSGTVKNCAVLNSTLNRSYSDSGAQTIGGIADGNNGTVQNCYTYNVVFTNASAAGGIVARGTAPRNSYFYTTSTTSSIVDGTAKNAKEFASGEVAYLLNGSISTPAAGEIRAWYQNLDNGGTKDTYPVLDSTHGVVYLGDSAYTNISNMLKPAGEGTSTSPYEIANAGNLYWFAAKVNGTEADGVKNGSACAKLVNDITVNTGVLNDDGTLSENNANVLTWTPLGTDISPYSGTFDGAGHTIKGLYVNATTNNAGLVGYNNGTIQNVNVVDSYFKNTQYHTGGVCGYNNGTIENCTNSGSVSCSNKVGGICGYNNNGTIENCTNSGNVSGVRYVGGVSGYNCSTITNCANNGSISGGGSGSTSWPVGGVSGTNEAGTIENCTNSGIVSGIIISGATRVGSVCGGNSEGTIKNCYYDNDKCSVGGIGDAEVIGSAEAKTTAEFASGAVAYLLNGGTNPPAEGATLAWYQNLDNGETVDTYPVLDSTHGVVYLEKGAYTNNPKMLKPAGEGTSASPYQIANAANLYWFAATVNGTDGLTKNTAACATLKNDITVNTSVLKTDGTLDGDGSKFRAWTPIGPDGYYGTFDGSGHTIKGLYVNTDVHAGLIGWNYGTIQNVNVADSYFKGGTYVGSVCGENSGTIMNCTNSGSVSGISTRALYVGGVCGSNNKSITNCINSGRVSTGISIGGVCGMNGVGAITNCINIGSVLEIKWNAGGVCGDQKRGTITNCYYDNEKCTVGGIDGSDVAGSAEGKTTMEFASGAVTWLLNGSYSDGIFTPGATDGSQTWYQNLATAGGDAYPTLVKNTDYTVYQKIGYDDNGFRTSSGYTNTAVATLPYYQKPETGDGTKTAPYQIANAGNLYWFAAKVNGTEADGIKKYDACAKLVSDITVNTGVLNEDGTLSGDGSKFRMWTPIGNATTNPYGGTFDGDGHTIKGLYVNTTDDYTSLIGYSIGTIQNVNVADSYFEGGKYVGSVCGQNMYVITNCTNSGSVSGSSMDVLFIGGVCGVNEAGSITNCINSGSVSTGDSVGGVCGQIAAGTITNCINLGSVLETKWNAGGVCGYRRGGTITNCYYDKVKCTVGGIKKEDVLGSAEGKTTEFASGAVAYLLNGSISTPAEGGTLAWYQNLDNGKTPDAYPVLDGSHGTVYKLADGNYSNSNVVAPTANSVQGHSLTLDGTIGVNFYIELTDEVKKDTSAVVEMTRDGKTITVNVSDAIAEGCTIVKDSTGTNHNCYKFSYHVYAKQMTDTITVNLKTGDGTSTLLDTYSVAQYAEDAKDTSDTNLKNLAAAMIGYGGHAQTLLAYHTDRLAGGSLTDVSSVTAETLSNYAMQLAGESAGISYYGAKLTLIEKTKIRLFFELKSGNIADYSFTVDGVAVTPTLSEYADVYCIEIPDIAAQDLEQTHTIKADGITISNYSALSWCHAALNIANVGQTDKNVGGAIYLYWKSAEAYYSK